MNINYDHLKSSTLEQHKMMNIYTQIFLKLEKVWEYFLVINIQLFNGFASVISTNTSNLAS